MARRLIPWGWLGLIALLFGAGALRAAEVGAGEVALTLDPKSAHQLEITTPAAGVWEIRTTDTDPFVATLPFPAAPKAASVLTFEYLCIGGIKSFEVFAGFPWSESRAQTADEVPHSEAWTTFSLDLRPAIERGGTPLTRLRLDFGRQAGHLIQVRNLRLRTPDAGEAERDQRRVARRDAERARDERLRRYLGRTYAARVTRVAVSATTVAVTGTTGGEGGELWLVESPIWQHVADEKRLPRVARLTADGAGDFSITVPRRRPGTDAEAVAANDRLLSRWLVIRAGRTEDEVVSALHYADTVDARSDLSAGTARTKKGLGGFLVGRPELAGDLEALDITSVTVNLFLSRFLRTRASGKTLPFEYRGRTYHADRTEVEKLDRTLRAAAARRALVFGILLVPKAEAWDTPELGAVLQHPDCEPAGAYSMANVTSAAGVVHTAALVDFLAERYSRPEQPHGRIHHWIVHNEVDAGWTWTNCGEKPPALYVDQYHKAMRLAHLIARQYDPRARAYISLTHYWTWTANFRYTPSRDVLRHLLAFSRAEGDFDWGIAFHPYPESLREPKTWRDRRATFAYDTPLITFKNIEVLDAWAKVPAHRYRGEQVRSIHLTEQGPNSPDYGPVALAEQAASMAYVWKKLAALDAIEGFQFHNWVDNRQEGGLRIGLRRFPDDPAEPLGRKPVWHVYRALGTAEEDVACAFALPIIGVKTWREVPYRGKITGEP